MKSRVRNPNIFKSDDNREIIITVGELKRQFKEEYDRLTDEIFDSMKDDIAAQMMAVCMAELEKEFGFGKKRLGQFQRGVMSLFEITDTIDCIEHIRKKYGIDVDKNGG